MKILRPEVLKCVKYNVTGKHGALERVDDLFLMSFNVTDDEFNFICANANSDEIEMLVGRCSKRSWKQFTVIYQNKDSIGS